MGSDNGSPSNQPSSSLLRVVVLLCLGVSLGYLMASPGSQSSSSVEDSVGQIPCDQPAAVGLRSTASSVDITVAVPSDHETPPEVRKADSPSITTLADSLTNNQIVSLVRATETVCGGNYGELWKRLCENHFASRMVSMLSSTHPQVVRIVQIGAHVGWNGNDPLAKGMTALLQSLPKEVSQRLEWTLIEASPTIYSSLREGVKRHSAICSIKTMHAGVVPDTHNDREDLVFYAIDGAVNVRNGRDSKSGKKLPFWASQISSFSKKNVLKHAEYWEKEGLNISDYIVATPVPTKRLSEVVAGNTLFALIDTEGLDCDIVGGIRSRNEMPPFLLYENKHCNSPKEAEKHLQKLGFDVIQVGRENSFAYRKDDR